MSIKVVGVLTSLNSRLRITDSFHKNLPCMAMKRRLEFLLVESCKCAVLYGGSGLLRNVYTGILLFRLLLVRINENDLTYVNIVI